ncbi:unnamed protein product [Notodromas monacha]|uniref:Pecanex-like protein n=1 Tax=Notodromas monacha TaxID=399045 RepID=A0A7R9BFH7_9CRUS|nr:unnamed protein product [Notodromas monacha]CAG0914458.1 unnamed protein product [Notodromas monacha]
MRDSVLLLILCFPLIFSFGLLPQVNTFANYFLEQVDIHYFGGTASTGLISACYVVIRSIAGIAALYGFAYAGLKEPQSSQHIFFSVFCGLLVAVSYHLSRLSSDPGVVWELVKSHIWMGPEPDDLENTSEADIKHKDGEVRQNKNPKPEGDVCKNENSEDDDLVDPLPAKLAETVSKRFASDLVIGLIFGVLAFAVHCSTLFTAAQPVFGQAMWIACGSLGFYLHYLLPHFRKEMPWKCFSRPFFLSAEYHQWEATGPAKIIVPEKIYVWLCIFEKYVLCTLLSLSAITADAPTIAEKFGVGWGALIVTIAGMKLLRGFFCDNSQTYLLVVLTALFFRVDYVGRSETYLLDLFFARIVLSKLYEFLLKMRFVITYIAPWQITWGSAFHAFAQPFSIPHSAMLFLQGLFSATVSAPLQPFLGSAIFLTSYVRPVKFWERDYNTKRVDHSNTRLASQVERNPGADDNNLNSIFYEHLTRSLQHSLCGDLTFGRWGATSQGDVFMLASDNLNCLVHIIEMGNGLVTFQVRGLEFRGTYCQQREVEAIVEGVGDNRDCCCCKLGRLPRMLSGNAAFNQRWLAWEVTATKYIVEGYSISDNSAVSMFQMFDLRKVLVTYCVKSLIYYVLQAGSLENWLSNETMLAALKPMEEDSYVDLDPVFHSSIDEDYDFRLLGVSKSRFLDVYQDWLKYVNSRRSKPLSQEALAGVATLCFGLCLVARRTLGQNSTNFSAGVDMFLNGLHNLFKGVFDTASTRDEWIYAADMDLVKKVVIPSVRMSLKLQQDHYISKDEHTDDEYFYDSIVSIDKEYVLAHEADPIWRASILQNKPHMLALRHVQDEGGAEEYRVIMLSKKYLAFRVIKVNRECVRGLWAGQQQELVYLRNRNPERGSIQNAKQVLRNIINSSCDQPIGYPIYVSPLTTSYAETNEQLCSVIGGYISLDAVRRAILNAWRRLRIRCGESCSSGGSMPQCEDPAFGQEGTYATNHNLPGAAGLTSGYSTCGSHSAVPLQTFIPMATFCPTSRPYLDMDESRFAGASMGSFGISIGGAQNSGRSRAGGATVGGLGSASRRLGTTSLPANVSASMINPYQAAGEVGRLGATTTSLTGSTVPPSWDLGRMSPRLPSPMALQSGPRAQGQKALTLSGVRMRCDPLLACAAEAPRNQPMQDLDQRSKQRIQVFASMMKAALEAEAEATAAKRALEGNGSLDPVELPRVRISDANLVFDAINLGRRVDVQWPDENMRLRGGRDYWKNWVPVDGMEGTVVHKWIPFHQNPVSRSHLIDKTILLVQIGDRFVPIAENGITYLNDSSRIKAH